jgi:hypothetical protein
MRQKPVRYSATWPPPSNRASDYTSLGLPETRLEHNTAAAAINLIRLDAWWTGKPLDGTRTTHLQRLDLTA